MTKMIKGLSVFAVCFAVGFAIWVWPFFNPAPSETVLETWEYRSGGVTVVVTAYAEKNSLVPGAYYLFEAVGDSNNRREIMTFRHDDQAPIRKDAVLFFNDKIGYVFMGWKYAVTTDAGLSWHVWSADKDLPGWVCCNYELIHNVQIAPDGTGTMILNPTHQREERAQELHTKDYGRHWSVK